MEDSTPKGNSSIEGLNSAKESSPTINEKKLAKALLTLWKTVFSSKDEGERKRQMVENLTRRANAITGDPALGQKLIEIVQNETDAPVEEWMENIANKFSAELLGRWSLEEIEGIFRESHISGGMMPVNRMFTANIENDGKILKLHVPIFFPSNPLEIHVLIKDAIKRLQNLLQDDPSLAKVESIRMVSNLVFTYPSFFQKYGFEVTVAKDEVDKAAAEMSV